MDDLGRRVHNIRARNGPPDAGVAALADLQHGVVARWELLELGLSQRQISHRLEQARLHRVYRGVYAVGRRRLDRYGRWMAAVLACGRDALVSHGSAIALWQLRPEPTGPVEVTAARSRAGLKGICVHRPRSRHPADATHRHGIPVTTPARTLLDYAATARPQQLRLALEAAERQDLLDGGNLNALLARSRGHRGHGGLRRAVQDLNGPAPWTQSELERAFQALIREGGLPEPQTNVVVAGKVVDFYWPAHRLVAEVDGYGFHKGRRAFESDRRQDATLLLAGLRVIRPTQRRIEGEPRRLLSELKMLLSDGGAASGR